MGGAVKAVGQTVGLVKKSVGQAAQNVADVASEKPRASRMDEEQGARMRGARRRGRALLSDARLKPSQGETLGGGNNLG